MSYFKTIKAAFLLLLLSFPTASICQADQVIGHSPDNIKGQMVGGWSGVLLGGAAGGPAGAILGGLAGYWSGGKLQQASGTSDNAYLVKSEDGQIQRLRSPNHEYQTGDVVAVIDQRPLPNKQQQAKAD